MKQFIITTIFCIFAALPVAADPITVAQMLEIRDRAATGTFAGRAEWNAFTFYLQGVIEGTASYQKMLIDKDGKPLFCPPKGMGHSLDDLVNGLARSSDADRNQPVSFVVLETYVKKYPCKK